jgi:MFS family permease
MSILSLVEDRPTPKEVYNWRVYLLAAVASFTSCMIGYDSAFIGTTLSLQSFKDEFNWESLDSDLISANIVSLYQAGAFFGALFAYPAGHFFGRRWGLMASALIFFLGAGLMLGANGDRGLGLIYGGRVLAGIGVGAGSNLCPIYISEMAPPAIRGRLVGVYELGWQLGGVVGFWINVCSLYLNILFNSDRNSTVSTRPLPQATSNGSSPLQCSSSLLVCSSSAPSSSRNRLDGSSSVATGTRASKPSPGSATSPPTIST